MCWMYILFQRWPGILYSNLTQLQPNNLTYYCYFNQITDYSLLRSHYQQVTLGVVIVSWSPCSPAKTHPYGQKEIKRSRNIKQSSTAPASVRDVNVLLHCTDIQICNSPVTLHFQLQYGPITLPLYTFRCNEPVTLPCHVYTCISCYIFVKKNILLHYIVIVNCVFLLI